MKTASILFAALLLATGATHAANLAKDTLVPCAPAICGDFPQNQATFGIALGNVAVNGVGRPIVTLRGLYDLATGQIAANKSLDLHYGMLVDQVGRSIYLGSFKTDAYGNYTGAAVTSGGTPYVFPAGHDYSGSFMVNDPALPNTQFITGFRR